MSQGRIKDAMQKGAVWIIRPGKKRRRLRRATATLIKGDCLEIYYDPRILAIKPDRAILLKDVKEYSLWFKPPGMLSQGTDYGDHASILRQAEKTFPGRKVFPVHRLDREAAGLILIAHSKTMAAALSTAFRDGRIAKTYHVTVRGRIDPPAGEISAPLDGKEARTTYHVLGCSAENDTSDLEVLIHTGRLHQIRRHLASIGHPVMGDPRYGKGNSHPDGLQLTAVRLVLDCPIRHSRTVFDLEDLMDQGCLSGDISRIKS